MKILEQNNINRIIRIRSILKKRIDHPSDFVDLDYVESFKKERKKNFFHDNQTIIKLGPPSFIKTKFKVSTTRKVSDGKNFGLSN